MLEANKCALENQTSIATNSIYKHGGTKVSAGIHTQMMTGRPVIQYPMVTTMVEAQESDMSTKHNKLGGSLIDVAVPHRKED